MLVVEGQAIDTCVRRAPNRPLRVPGDERGILQAGGFPGTNRQRAAHVEAVADIKLWHRCNRRRYVDNPRRCGQALYQSGVHGPPAIAAVEDNAILSGTDQPVRPGSDRPALFNIEIAEGLGVLAFPDMLWDDHETGRLTCSERVDHP